MVRFCFCTWWVGAFLLAGTGTVWSDTTQELRMGGLVFSNARDVILESEEVRVSPETVSFSYRILNLSPAPATLSLTFPMSDIDVGDQDALLDLPSGRPEDLVDFHTSVDGVDVAFEKIQKAYHGSDDVTALLRKARLPLLALGNDANRFQANITAMLPESRQALLDRGIIVEFGADPQGQVLYAPNWVVKTKFVRSQRIPSGQATAITHAYKTSVGRSQDTVLRRALRTTKSLEALAHAQIQTYCVEDDFLRKIDRIAGSDEANTVGLREWQISLALRTFDTTLGPAKDYRIIIDKVKPERLVSFCLEGVRKSSPTVFEIRRLDFKPDRDLKILIIDPFENASTNAHPPLQSPP